MSNAKRISACLLCALLFLSIPGPGALAAVQVAPVSIPVGRVGSEKAEFFGLFLNGEIDTNTRYSDITRITFGAPGIAEAFEGVDGLYIRGLAEGAVSFRAVSASAGVLTGTIVVYASESISGEAVFERGDRSVVIPKTLELFSGQTYSFYAQSAAFAIESDDKSVPTRTLAVLGHNRDRIFIRTSEPGTLNLYVRDNPTGNVAVCKVIITDLQFQVDFARNMKIPLRVGETVTPSGKFLPAVTEEQLEKAQWISFNTDIASVDPATGVITAHSPGIAGIFLYLPLTDRYYGLGIGHYDEERGDVVYGVLVE